MVYIYIDRVVSLATFTSKKESRTSYSAFPEEYSGKMNRTSIGGYGC